MSNLDHEDMREFQEEFLNEASSLLDECQEDLLELEKCDSEDEQDAKLASIFRVAHNVKGTSAAVGLAELSTFTHKFEDLLSALRVRPINIRPEVISLLLQCNDKIMERVKALLAGQNQAWDTSSLVDEISKELQTIKSQAHKVDPDALEMPSEVSMAQPTEETSKKKVVPIKVDPNRVESVLNNVGELVVLKSQIFQEEHIATSASQRLNSLMEMLDKTIRDLHTSSLELRLTSIKPLFTRLERISRDLSVKLEKPVTLQVDGAQTEVDRSMIETLSDPLVHIIRNAMDHGIEKEATRLERNKPHEATIKLSARHTAGQVVIEVVDDGGGIDRERVLTKSIENGIVDENIAKTMTDQEVYMLLFASGFSTAAEVTDVSGRGVGLDVVKTQIEKMGGTIEVDSKPKVGTTFSLAIPLTTAIEDGLIVAMGKGRFILPTRSVKEFHRYGEAELVETHTDTDLFKVGEAIYPQLSMAPLYVDRKVDMVESDKKILVIVESREAKKALPVTAIVGKSQFVIKPLGLDSRQPKGISGASILGNGQVALIMDVETLIKLDPDPKPKSVQDSAQLAA